MSALAAWRHGAWRIGAWRTDSWRGMGAEFDVAFFERRRTRHKGWNRQRATLRLQRERRFDRAVRQIYRQVLGIPETALRAREIIAAHDQRILVLRERRIEAERVARDTEIALLMLHGELQAMNDAKDEAAIEALLPKVL